MSGLSLQKKLVRLFRFTQTIYLFNQCPKGILIISKGLFTLFYSMYRITQHILSQSLVVLLAIGILYAPMQAHEVRIDLPISDQSPSGQITQDHTYCPVCLTVLTCCPEADRTSTTHFTADDKPGSDIHQHFSALLLSGNESRAPPSTA